MREQYCELRDELIQSLIKSLLEFEYTLGERNEFYNDIEIDHHIFDVLSDHLWKRTMFAETISDLVKSQEEANAFDEEVRKLVYDALHRHFNNKSNNTPPN